MSLFDPQTPRRFKNEMLVLVFSAPHPLPVPPTRVAPGRVFSKVELPFPLLTFISPFPITVSTHCLLSLPIQPCSSCKSWPSYSFVPADDKRTSLGSVTRGLWASVCPGAIWAMVPRSLSPYDPYPLTLLPPSEPSKAQGVLCEPFNMSGARKRSSPSLPGNFMSQGLAP